MHISKNDREPAVELQSNTIIYSECVDLEAQTNFNVYGN